MIGELWNAFRSLLRTRRVTTLAVIATIGIVLGGVTMIFGLVNVVLLRPLPYPNADRLVTVRLNDRAVGLRWFMPLPLFEQLPSRVRSADCLSRRGSPLPGGSGAQAWARRLALSQAREPVGAVGALGRNPRRRCSRPGRQVRKRAVGCSRTGGPGRAVGYEGRSHSVRERRYHRGQHQAGSPVDDTAT
jgi:hypothetical protein